MSGPRLAVVGAGSLARALLSGWSAAGTRFTSVVTVNRSASGALQTATGRLPAGTTTTCLEDDPDALEHSVRAADVVVLAVKPHLVREVAAVIGPALRDGAVVVSVAAGIRRETVAAALRPGVQVVRAMPNTPSAVRRGVIGLVADPRVTVDAYTVVRRIFGELGRVVEVDEDQLDGVVAVAGSGPAYVFLLVEKLTEAAVAQGFDRATSSMLAEEVFRGALELMASTGEAPSVLRRKVTSPNGTTERAVAVFEDGRLGELFHAAVDACRHRARELGA